jgi:hypothetical protein
LACSAALALLGLLVVRPSPDDASADELRPVVRLAPSPGTTPRPDELPTSHLREKLRLTISSSGVRIHEAGKAQLALRATIANVSRQPVRVHIQTCGTCFWTISFNGRDYQRAARTAHARKGCVRDNLVQLQPEETRTIDWRRSFTEEEARRLTTVRLRYRLDSTGEQLESNELTLPPARFAPFRRGCGCSMGATDIAR